MVFLSPIHIKVKKGDIAERVVFGGDPGRIEQLSKLLSDVRLVNKYRGFLIYTGKYEDVPITIATHGIGTQSASIVAEELISMGAKALVRLGSCGALIKGLKIGDAVIPTGCSYYPGGLFYQYLGEWCCAASTPNYELLSNLVEETGKTGLRYYIGPVVSSEAFYAEDPEFAKRWGERGNIAVEMECSALFLLGHLRKVKMGALLIVSDSLVEDLGFAGTEELREFMEKAATAAFRALIKTSI